MSFQDYASWWLELFLAPYNLTAMIQEPNHHTKIASQICQRKVKFQIFLLFYCFALHFCSFYTLSLHKGLQWLFNMRSTKRNFKPFWLSWLQEKLTRKKKCFKSSQILIEDKQGHKNRLSEWTIWDKEFHIRWK